MNFQQRISPYVFAIFLLAVLSGCGKDPKKLVFHENQADQILAQAKETGKLTQEESELLVGYMMRAKLGGLFGAGTGLKLEGMTLGQMIDDQKDWVSKEKAEEDAKKAADAKRKEEAKAYFDKVKVSKVEIGRSVLDEKGVFGEIKNTGDKTLSEVEITIYCLNKQDQPIFDKTYRPVLDSEFSIRSEGPLKPNYSRKFGCKLDDAPSEWAGKVKVEVSDVKFK